VHIGQVQKRKRIGVKAIAGKPPGRIKDGQTGNASQLF
jgi:hypothetical protein